MFGFVFRFPCGRYHATPWGRHVNEGDVAWPPEPYRILRTLIATWHRSAQEEFDESSLSRLIDALASELPRYRLPVAVHAHSRHYMPTPSGPKLVFDAFLRIAPKDPLIAAWPNLTLAPELFALASHLADRISYFGRAESTVLADSENQLDPDFTPNCSTERDSADLVKIQTLAPLSAEAYSVKRTRLLVLNTDKAKSKRRLAFEATLPPSLMEALQVDTASLQSIGWSHPPAGQLVVYHRPEVGPRSPPSVRRAVNRPSPAPTVARLIVAGRPRPRIEDAVKIGEALRLAIMSRINGEIPYEISGRDADGRPASDPGHGHAFFLPEDADRDGLIDHIVLYTRDGLSSATRRALDRLHQLWIADRGRIERDDDDPERGRKEWRVALEGLGDPADFTDSNLLRPAIQWESATPYLRPWHTKTRNPHAETLKMVGEECQRRGLPLRAADFGKDSGRSIEVQKGASRNVLQFHRFRSRRGLNQPDRSGSSLVLIFENPINGPLALGFGCHYGLGLMRAAASGDVIADYRAMAADEVREREVEEWVENLAGDVADESR